MNQQPPVLRVHFENDQELTAAHGQLADVDVILWIVRLELKKPAPTSFLPVGKW
ncbi:MAG: hypothetical protein NXI04_04750 [Planctomycetaceae bacterium]|nr:hypothetical protein [Planctomycetaceae bacterium]